MGLWQQSLDLFGWPAWPITALATPVGAAISFNVAFRKGITRQWQPHGGMLYGALGAGVWTVLPAMLAGAWLSGSMGGGRAAIAWRWDIWERHYGYHYHHGVSRNFLRDEFRQRFRDRRKALMDWLYR